MRIPVLVPAPFPGLPTYRLPDELPPPAVGARVAVPFGSRVLTGLRAPGEAGELPPGVSEREVLAVFDDQPFLTPPLVSVLLRAAAYYFAPPGELLRAAVPARLLGGGAVTFAPTAAAIGAAPADPRAAEVLAEVVGRGRADALELAERLGSRGLARALRDLAAAGLVRVSGDELRKGRAPVTRSFTARPLTPRAAEALVRRRGQRALHEALLALGRPASAAEVRSLGGTPALLTGLVSVGAVSVAEEERGADLAVHAGRPIADRPLTLGADQASAVGAICRAMAAGEAAAFLVAGVTGSGKTEVYLEALARAAAGGRQGILLVPEIALAPALVRRAVARFSGRVSLLHSGLSDGERAAEWERARRGAVDVVIGPRSAVFAPLPRLGLVVVDEAHDASYKQAESPRYDARSVARVRGREEGAVVVLGSATPSMEQEQEGSDGRLVRLSLPARVAGRPRAPVEVVDVRKTVARPGDHGRVLFAERTLEVLGSAFAQGDQAILLLNRRGFAPSLLCRPCGHDFRCTQCSVARTYHRRGETLLCHYCGDSIQRPLACPACGASVLMPVGFGTERLAERFEEAFPGIPYAVLDRDAAARRGGAALVLSDFESGRARALLGTQMVAKGHDFPNATALAVLDADALLSFPDFRAAERTFQLVTQAAGRIGRGEKPGLVVVQTASPGHEAIRAAVAQDQAAFAAGELRFRRAFGYPPFAHLLLALFAGEDRDRTAREADQAREALLASGLPALERLRILGPAPAPLERLQGRWRFQLLLKAPGREALAEAGAFLARLPAPPRLDRDPQSLM